MVGSHLGEPTMITRLYCGTHQSLPFEVPQAILPASPARLLRCMSTHIDLALMPPINKGSASASDTH